MDEINNECTILVPKTRKTMAAQGGNPNKSVTFSFDRCYNNMTTTAQIYNEIPYSLVQVYDNKLSFCWTVVFAV
jgi:hypothetical protein